MLWATILELAELNNRPTSVFNFTIIIFERCMNLTAIIQYLLSILCFQDFLEPRLPPGGHDVDGKSRVRAQVQSYLDNLYNSDAGSAYKPPPLFKVPKSQQPAVYRPKCKT